MKWFSIKGIFEEIKKVRWPALKELRVNSIQVVIFVLFFALFFLACSYVIGFILTSIGVI